MFEKGNNLLAEVLVAAVFLLVILFGLFPICNYDVGLHIKTGEYIVSHLSVPKTNVFSCANPDFRMVDDKWLFQVMTYLIYRPFGFHGLVVFRILMILGAFLLAASAGFQSRRPMACLVPVTAALVLCSRRLYFRPDLASLFFLSLYYFLFMKERRTGKRYFLFFIPLIHVLWANIHGYFMTGLILIALFWAAELLAFLREVIRKKGMEQERIVRISRLKSYGLVFVLSGAASFLNPNFHLGALFPVNTLLELMGPSRGLFDYIMEFASPWKSYPFVSPALVVYPWFLAASLLVLLAYFIRSLFRGRDPSLSGPGKESIEGASLLLFLALLAMSFTMERNIPQFALLSIPILACALNALSRTFETWMPRLWRWIVPAGRILFLFLLVFLFAEVISNRFYFRERSHKTFGSGVSKWVLPEGGLSFVRENGCKGNAFTSFERGSAFVYGCYPDNLPFIDGNTFGYDIDFFMKYTGVMKGEVPFSEVVNEHDLRIVFLGFAASHEPMIQMLLRDPLWRFVYFDGFVCIFLKRDSANRAMIDQFGFLPEEITEGYVEETIKAADPYQNFWGKCSRVVEKALSWNGTYPLALSNWARFFAVTGQEDRAIQYYEKAREENGDFTESYLGLAQLYCKMGDLRRSEENARKCIAMDSSHGAAYFTLAFILSERQQFKKAKKAYRKALALDPDFIPALTNLAFLEYGQGEFDEARKWFLRLKELNPQDGNLNMFLGYIAEKRREYSKAVEYLETYLEGKPLQGEVHFHLGVCYFELGDKQKAFQNLDRSLFISSGAPYADEARRYLQRLK